MESQQFSHLVMQPSENQYQAIVHWALLPLESQALYLLDHSLRILLSYFGVQ